MSVLVFSEKDEIAFELLAKARTVFPDAELAAVLITSEPSDKASKYFGHGADIVYLAYSNDLKVNRLESCALTLRNIIETKGITTILIGSTRMGKSTASQLSQMLNCACVTDAVDIRTDGDVLQANRYALAGNTIATEILASSPRVIAIMPHAFKMDDYVERKGRVEEIEVPTPSLLPRLVEKREKKGEQVNLEDARIIVGVGKGFAKPEDLELARELTSVLKAELGCTRPLAVDFKWLAEDRSIGLSSKKVAPDLYIAVGISGQIQHTVGVMQARTIVAINKSEDAPMFDFADYGIVGDLYKVLPLLTDEIKKMVAR